MTTTTINDNTINGTHVNNNQGWRIFLEKDEEKKEEVDEEEEENNEENREDYWWKILW